MFAHMVFAKIKHISSYLPQTLLDNNMLAKDFPEWDAEKIAEKTGIRKRYIADKNETALDMAIHASKKLMNEFQVNQSEIDFVLLCTQSPEYFLPTSACILQHKLEIPTSAGALDFNLGCSGYVYGLSLAKSLIESMQAKNVLLVTSETYSKYIRNDDKSVRTLFGDGATATLVCASNSKDEQISKTLFGSDGSGFDKLIVKNGASKNPQSTPELFMDGPEIFNFTLASVPSALNDFLSRENLTIENIDAFVFHQANSFMLEALRKKCKIPKEKFILKLEGFGNTVSSTIPMAIEAAKKQGELKPGQKVCLVGFGVGYSWAINLVTL
jgi:3-oxoacyl-[acyl-carrier-protein] synthase-3